MDSVRCDKVALQVEKLTAEKTKAEKEKVDNKVKKKQIERFKSIQNLQ